MPASLLLSTAFLGPVSYYAHAVHASSISMEVHEHYVKQSFRNRCQIYGAYGQLNLSVPVINGRSPHQSISEIRISYDHPWQVRMWRTLEAAYRSSPYFEYYENDLKELLFARSETLLELNNALHQGICKLVDLDLPMAQTEGFQKIVDEGVLDHRGIHPNPDRSTGLESPLLPRYHQVFEQKHGFLADLSIVDLVCSLGPGTPSYLKGVWE